MKVTLEDPQGLTAEQVRDWVDQLEGAEVLHAKVKLNGRLIALTADVPVGPPGRHRYAHGERA